MHFKRKHFGYMLSSLIVIYFSIFAASMFLSVFVRHGYENGCTNDFTESVDEIFSCKMEYSEELTDKQFAEFPKHIHQMFFYETDKSIPKRLETARRTWIDRQHHFRYTLWNASMVENLIKTKYCQLLKLYRSYDHWVRRADMARYVVLYEYGGVYVDIDIKSRFESLDDLYSKLKKTSGIALYVTKPAVVTNDFMIAKPKHPFMKSVLCGLESSNQWYVLPYLTTMMATGPLYLHSQYRSYTQKDDIEIIDSKDLSDFISHIHGAAWHQWDGVLIWWIFRNRQLVTYISLASLFSVIVLFCLWKFRNKLRYSYYCKRGHR